MSSHRRNVLVGMTVLVAVALLIWMILRFSDAPFQYFKVPRMPIQFVATGAEGIGEGSPVFYLGVSVGRVEKVRRNPLDPMTVLIDAMVDEEPPLPANIEGVVRTQLLGGAASISLVLLPDTQAEPTGPTTQPATRRAPAPIGRLQRGQQVPARFVGVDILPPEIARLADELSMSARAIHSSDLIPALIRAVNAIQDSATKASRILDDIQAVTGDSKLQSDLRQTASNIREVSETATRVARNLETLTTNANARVNELAEQGSQVLASARKGVDEVSRSVIERLAQADAVLRRFESIARKLDQGKGTAGQLVNDAALYESLLDVSKELKLAIQDIRRTVQGWEQEGVPMKLR